MIKLAERHVIYFESANEALEPSQLVGQSPEIVELWSELKAQDQVNVFNQYMDPQRGRFAVKKVHIMMEE